MKLTDLRKKALVIVLSALMILTGLAFPLPAYAEEDTVTARLG